MPVTVALRWLRQEDHEFKPSTLHSGFEASLGYNNTCLKKLNKDKNKSVMILLGVLIYINKQFTEVGCNLLLFVTISNYQKAM